MRVTMIAPPIRDLWSLVKFRPNVDADDLAAAAEEQAVEEKLDYRTRLLLRDSLWALQKYWGKRSFQEWLEHSPRRQRLEVIMQEEFERAGFPSLERRLMKKTDPEEIRRYLREVGDKVSRPLRLEVGGSSALIVPGYLAARFTDDVDVVDEVPAELRAQHDFLNRLEERYGLKLAHFQRHYLPMEWESRLHYLDTYGSMQVYLVDAVDVFLSKLSSIREKDFDDMREVAPQLDRAQIVRILKGHYSSVLASPVLRQRCEENWKKLFGETLPA